MNLFSLARPRLARLIFAELICGGGFYIMPRSMPNLQETNRNNSADVESGEIIQKIMTVMDGLLENKPVEHFETEIMPEATTIFSSFASLHWPNPFSEESETTFSYEASRDEYGHSLILMDSIGRGIRFLTEGKKMSILMRPMKRGSGDWVTPKHKCLKSNEQKLNYELFIATCLLKIKQNLK